MEQSIMSAKKSFVLVLWGKNFDAVIASIFVSELRQAGLRVKVVALDNQRITGAHGLTLVPDLTLGKALPLANRSVCIVLPCDASRIRYFSGDPRIALLFQRSVENDARFVMGAFNCKYRSDIAKLALPMDEVLTYPECEALFPFVRQMALNLPI